MNRNFAGAALRLGDIDIPRIGSEIGVGEDELHAFMDVEASGSGFDHMNRPKMLFEPHVFYGMLGKGSKRDAAVAQGLAYPKWGEKPYPSDSYPRLIKAMAIDETAALRSASWGLTQILGRYHADIGYASPQEMVEEFANHEAEHLEATVKLLKAWKVDDDLRAHRWAVVAETWNGPGYRKNRYDTKLEAAFAKWQKIKDTPWSPTAPAPQPASPVPIVPIPAAPAPAAPPAPAVVERDPQPVPAPTSKAPGIIAVVVLALGSAAAWLAHLPCNIFGVLCQ
ncbi:N-acetylmuramidase family protein [Mesorhizobium sp. M4B.F.Ca.ET.017.02.2.1]|uniref:N-acetylmuramidase family protein n=1 Tax=Mesorhizobium sp. M4B.F.Ca.ET.017.02.2.1 TaxID=2496649 RepID=UPI000FCA5D0E|nr:N-acetylmuramidase family protein [Mesorhizobium sp. M4B.F.Ca.ET.017.02.2.1]RVD31416.1 N-acetylmuramidase family protein [Mesorhizobium sp. M4B.F.Ca.ET.017.02.2.1]